METIKGVIMFGRFVKNKPSILDDQIIHILNEMNRVRPDSEGYSIMSKNLERLYRLKEETHKSRVNPDVMAIVIGNILGILTIVAYEQKHVMVSKGLGFVLKTRDTHI